MAEVVASVPLRAACVTLTVLSRGRHRRRPPPVKAARRPPGGRPRPTVPWSPGAECQAASASRPRTQGCRDQGHGHLHGSAFSLFRVNAQKRNCRPTWPSRSDVLRKLHARSHRVLPPVAGFRFYSPRPSWILGCFFRGIPAPGAVGVCTPLTLCPGPRSGGRGVPGGRSGPHVRTRISLQVTAQVSQSSRLPVQEADPRGSQALLPPPSPAGNTARAAEGSEHRSPRGAQLPQGCGGCTVSAGGDRPAHPGWGPCAGHSPPCWARVQAGCALASGDPTPPGGTWSSAS